MVAVLVDDVVAQVGRDSHDAAVLLVLRPVHEPEVLHVHVTHDLHVIAPALALEPLEPLLPLDE